MEENKKQILHGECPRKLNLNVPLLSTRRPFSVETNETSTLANPNTTSNMVPFSWERIPGEPKDKETNDNSDTIHLPPPPGRRAPPVAEEMNASLDRCCDYSDVVDEKYGHNERFSDAIDIFSLAESVDDDVEADCEATKDRSSAVMESNGYQHHHHSPNFIIERFLPDAQALAEASVMNKKFPFLSSPDFNDSFSRAVSIRRSYHSPKGCGLGSFFPWRMKPKPCSVKSPVCDTIIGANQKKNR